MAIPIVDYVPVQRDPYQIKKPEDASLYADAAMAADVQGESNFLRGTVIQGSQQGAVDPVTGKAPQWQSYTSPGYDPRDKEAIDTMIARGDIKKPADYEKTFGRGAQAPKAPEQKPAEKVNVLSSSDADAYVSDAERKAIEARKRLEDYAKEARGETKNMGYASLLPADDGNESQTEKDFRKAVEQGGIVGLGAGNALQGYKDANKFRKEAERQQALLDEVQASTKGTAKASEFYSGRSGSAYAADVISKLDRDQAQAQKEFGEQKADIMTQIWNQALGGSYAEAENLKKKADELDAKEAERQAKVAQLKKDAMDLQDRVEKKGVEAITDYAKGGVTPTKEQFEALDQMYFGGVTGSAQRKYQAEAAEIQISQAKDKLALMKGGVDYDAAVADLKNKATDQAFKMADFLAKTPTGGSVTVGGVDYTVTGKAPEYLEGTATDNEGNVTQYMIDKRTKEVTRISLGPIGGAKDGWQTQVLGDGSVWRVNPTTGQQAPFYASEAQITWNSVLPDGSTGPVLPGNPEAAGQCGALCNWAYGERVLGNTFGEKMAAMEKYGIKTADQVQVGDTFLMSAGDTGHVGIVNAVETGPGGQKVLRFTESNFVPPNGRQMSNFRTMNANDPKLKAFATIPIKNLPLAGPDSQATTYAAGGAAGRQILGQGTKTNSAEAKPVSADDLVKYGLDPKDPANIGLTLDQVKAKRGTETANTPATRTKETFDEFVARQENARGMSFSPAQRDNLKKEFEQGQQANKLYGQAIDTLSRSAKTVAAMGAVKTDLTKLLDEGDYDGLERAIRTEVRNGLSATNQQAFDQYDSGAETWEEASHYIDQAGEQISAGPYKFVIEEKKPFIGAQRDPAYTTLLQTIELGQAQIRRGFYGTAVTDTEAATAKKFLVDPETDDLATIKIKLDNGAKYMRWVNDATVASAAGLPKPKLSEYVDLATAAKLKPPRSAVVNPNK